MTTIAENLADIRNRIASALGIAGRAPGAARLLAVSKTFPVADIMEAYNAGQREFGENRPQELESKAPKMPGDITWHLIGHLQANKVRSAVRHAAWIHSVESIALLQRIERIAAEECRCPKILIEVNISGEESKFGVTPSQLPVVVQAAQSCSHLELQGLMTMAPAEAGEAELHAIFSGLRHLRDEMERQIGVRLSVLSMGMSHDFEIALAEGSTIVRVGTAIFGRR